MMEGGMHMNIAKEQLGHSTISITMDLYSHVTESLQEDAVAELDRVFWSQG
jgi:integrase